MKRIFFIFALVTGFVACADSDEVGEGTGYSRLVFEMEEDRLLVTADETVLNVFVEAAVSEDTDCRLYVPSNHEYLIDKFNSSNGTNYVLLPESVYELEGATMAKGETSASLVVRIDREKADAAYNGRPFVLPVKARAGEAYQTDSKLMHIVLKINRMSEIETVSLSSSGAYAEICYANPPSDKAILFCPGGGYGNLTPEEMTMAKDIFKDKGVTLAILHYRLPEGDWRRPYNDAVELLEKLKYMASEWGGYKKIGIMGCSAGGHLASLLAVRMPQDLDFQILLFPVISMDPQKTHYPSTVHFLGESPSQEMIERFSTELHVTGDCPAAYVAYSDDDPLVAPATNAQAYIAALRKCGVPVSEKQHSQGGHWWGNWSDFPTSMFDWLSNR